MMMPNCKGCKLDFMYAIEFQDEEGLHYAIEPFKKGHFKLLMVNDKGKVVVTNKTSSKVW